MPEAETTPPEQPEAEKLSPEEEKQVAAASSGGLRGVRILAVEDSKTMRMFLVRALKAAGAVVEEAENGAQALEVLRGAKKKDEPFQLVFTDINMPVMSGTEEIQKIRSDPAIASTPVIVLSTENERSVILECAKYGISSYVIKGAKTHKLLSAAMQALAGAGGKAGGAEERPGLSLAQLGQMRHVLLEAANKAIADGMSKAQKPIDEPVYRAFVAFVKNHCPEAIKA